MMRDQFNDALRSLIGLAILVLGLIFTAWHELRLRTSKLQQQLLKRRYRIKASTPILNFDSETERRIQAASARFHHPRIAQTSGSTARPKQIPYTRNRLRKVKLAYIDFFVRCCWSLRLTRKNLYVFNSIDDDRSLTSLLLEERGRPGYLSSLQAPYRVQSHPALKALAQEYGMVALRLWVLTLASPGILYATNPSTISTFFDALVHEWQTSTRLINDWVKNRQAFAPAVQAIARRISSPGCRERLERIANSTTPLALSDFAPGAEAYICWTGGYLQTFLDRLKIHLPPERYRLIPMYSMSTETIETVIHFESGRICFLPLARNVLYEFVAGGLLDQPHNLLSPNELQIGRSYALVISDPYGFRRYQTEDIFYCRGFSKGLPDLHFLGRRDLEYSFSGEKLTAQQVSTAFEKLQQEFPELEGKFLTCVPSHPHTETIPHYKVVTAASQFKSDSAAAISRRCDELLCQSNGEYRQKRESRRLDQVRLTAVSTTEFVQRMGGVLDAQFKFLPLYRRRWEETCCSDQPAPQQIQSCLRSSPTNQLSITG
jgi:hypothetical protein